MERDMMLKIIDKVKKIRTALGVMNTAIGNIDQNFSKKLNVTKREAVLDDLDTEYTIPSGGGWYRIYLYAGSESELVCKLNTITILSAPKSTVFVWALPLEGGSKVEFTGSGTAVLYALD